MKERRINVGAMVAEILLKWRGMVLVMIIGAVLAGGLSFIQSLRNVEAQRNAMALMQEQLKQKQELLANGGESATIGFDDGMLSDLQRSNVINALTYEQFVAETEQYLDMSVWANLNPLNIARTILVFRVEGLEGQACNNVKRLYEDAFVGGVYQWISENDADDLTSAALSELIVFSRATNDWPESREVYLAAGQESTDSFAVEIYHASEKESEELARYVVKYVEKLEVEMAAEVGAHEIVLVSEQFSYVADASMQGTLRNIKNNIMLWNTNIANLKAKFTAEEMQYYSSIKGENQSLEKEIADLAVSLENMVISAPEINPNYVILGAVLLGFAYLGVLLVQYIFSAKIHITDNMKELYDVVQLGMILKDVPRKKIGSIVDKGILMLRDRNRRRFTSEESIGLASAALKIAVKRENSDTVYCVGCDVNGRSLQVAEKMKKELSEAGIQMLILSNILYNQETMEQLQSARAVFLLETAGETLYEEVAKELELLQRQEIRMLGIVVAE